MIKYAVDYIILKILYPEHCFPNSLFYNQRKTPYKVETAQIL